MKKLLLLVITLCNIATMRAMIKQPKPRHSPILAEFLQDSLEKQFSQQTLEELFPSDEESDSDDDLSSDPVHDPIISQFLTNISESAHQSPATILANADQDIKTALSNPEISIERIKQILRKQIENEKKLEESTPIIPERLMACEVRLRLLQIKENQLRSIKR